jgi:predicted nucleic acid-binding protein
MNVVDSSAWLSYFADDGNADAFSRPIEKISELLVPSIAITEVFKNVLRQRGEEAALIVTAHMKQGRVGLLHKLPLADSIIFATAQKYGAVLWTQDNDFEGLENVRYIAKKST